jgi:hypothetical protein
MENKTPTGEEMIKRNRKHREQVESILPNFPPTRGDDLELWVTVLRKFYWKQVDIYQAPKGGALTIKFHKRENLYSIPCMESIRRRRQEIQHEQKELIWKQAAKNLNAIDNPQEDTWRETAAAQAEFLKLAKGNPYLPTERVLRKRRRNQDAQTNEFGSGQLSLSDKWNRD